MQKKRRNADSNNEITGGAVHDSRIRLQNRSELYGNYYFGTVRSAFVKARFSMLRTARDSVRPMAWHSDTSGQCDPDIHRDRLPGGAQWITAATLVGLILVKHGGGMMACEVGRPGRRGYNIATGTRPLFGLRHDQSFDRQ